MNSARRCLPSYAVCGSRIISEPSQRKLNFNNKVLGCGFLLGWHRSPCIVTVKPPIEIIPVSLAVDFPLGTVNSANGTTNCGSVYGPLFAVNNPTDNRAINGAVDKTSPYIRDCSRGRKYAQHEKG
ncbi:hypothetical protein [Shimia sp.]|uniref:hypothetical protein n=1 Tax=Shimia sp. TaxID=1954381 RepID=UPI003BAC2D85